MANTQFKLDRIHKGGAINGQILTWVDINNAWTPQNPGAGADGNGIYSTSGTIGNNVSSSTTNATLPTTSILNFRYFGNSNALSITDSTGEVSLFSKNTSGLIYTNDTNSQLFFDGKGLNVNAFRSIFNNAVEFSDTIKLTSTISPPQITANQNNYAPTGNTLNTTWRINSDAARNITGLASPSDGRVIVLHNVGSFTITLKNQDAGSLTANQFRLVADLPLGPGMSATLQYDNTAGVLGWRCIGIGSTYVTTGQGGIYAGSGTIAAGCTATLNNNFTINHTNGNGGLIVSTGNTSAALQSRNASALIEAKDSLVTIYANSGINQITLTGTNFKSNLNTFITSIGGTVDTNALLDVASTTKAFFPPRMTTGERDLIGAGTVNNGAFLYNATTNKFTGRQNGAWVEFQTGGDGNGIYSGSGTIGAGVAASTTSATLPATGAFKFAYNTGGDAMTITDNSQVQIFGPLGGSEFTAASTDISLAAGSNFISIGNTNNAMGGTMVITGPGGSGTLDTSALLDLGSTSKILYVPRMTTANQSAMGTPNNGGFHYNSDTNKFTFRQGGAWVELNTVAAGSGGIYGGSGTIASACAATVTASSSFRIKYNGGNNAINIDDTAGTTTLTFKTTSGAPAAGIQINSGNLFFYTGSSAQCTLNIDKATAKSTFNNSTLYVNTVNGTGTAGQNSGLELDATDKVFYPPRMTTTQRDAISTAGVDNGAMLYNSTTGKFTGRQGGAWVEFGTGAGTVTGSATTGQIAYWTGTTSIGGSSNMFFDTTNTRVGIGTSSPATLLHVAGHGRFDGAVLSRGAGGNTLDASSSIRLTNTTASTGVTWYITSKDLGGVDIQSSALGTIIGIAPTSGMVTTSASVAFPVVQTVSISSTQNNYSVDNGIYAMRATPSANLSITGFAASAGNHVAGRRFVFYNTDASNTFIITFKHQDAGSTNINRIITSNGADVTCRGGGSVVFWYDVTDAANPRWRVESAT